MSSVERQARSGLETIMLASHGLLTCLCNMTRVFCSAYLGSAAVREAWKGASTKAFGCYEPLAALGRLTACAICLAEICVTRDLKPIEASYIRKKTIEPAEATYISTMHIEDSASP